MKKKDSFLIFCGGVIVLMVIVFGIKIIMKETEASFDGISGSFGNGTKVIYYSNYPNNEIESKSYEYEGADSYRVLPNMFLVPDGYEFSGWGIYDIGPVLYIGNQYISVTTDMNLYAIWKKLEAEVIVYGDVDLNGIISMDDAKIIDNYVLDNSILSGQGLINADVNVDGKVDIIDADIIKQVCLGTEGYVGFLPEKPILIYEIYVKEDNADSSSGGTGDGGGTTGGGNGSSNSSGKKPNSSSSKKPSVNNDEDKNKDKTEEKKKYTFNFMNGDNEFAKTECLIIEDGTCLLVLPNTIPSMNNYKFLGWSIEVDCSKDIIKDSIMVSSGNTYYACFSKIENNVDKESKNSFSEWMIVGFVWLTKNTERKTEKYDSTKSFNGDTAQRVYKNAL